MIGKVRCTYDYRVPYFPNRQRAPTCQVDGPGFSSRVAVSAALRSPRRCVAVAIVGSETRNAFATSGVLTPQTSRRVSATWACTASAGWQHRKISRSRSSRTGASLFVLAGVSAVSGSTAGAISRAGYGPGAAHPARCAGPPSSARRRADRVSLHDSMHPARRGRRPARILRNIEVARDAHRRGEHNGPLPAVCVGDSLLDRPHNTWKSSSGRTSTPPEMIGVMFASASAWSRSRASSRKTPAATCRRRTAACPNRSAPEIPSPGRDRPDRAGAAAGSTRRCRAPGSHRRAAVV